jgi:hypothetical protein
MWLFTKYGFISAVCARKGEGKSIEIQPDLIMVRARLKEHLENLMESFPQIEWLNADDPKQAAKNPPTDAIRESKANDYRFRAYLSRSEFGNFMACLALDVSYGNFKSEVRRVDGPSAYEHSLHRVWGVMYGVQCAAYGSGIYSRTREAVEPDEPEIDFLDDAHGEEFEDPEAVDELTGEAPRDPTPSPGDGI